MKPSFVIYPYKLTSSSARCLQTYLQWAIEKPVPLLNEPYTPKKDETIINWGCGETEIFNEHNVKIYNPKHIINRIINKLDFFDHLRKYPFIPKPAYTVKKDLAVEWLKNGYKVYCRKTVEGRDGRGCIVATTPNDIPASLIKLFTVQVPSTHEYRVHVFQHRILTELLKQHQDKYNPDIRVGSQGWFYVQDVVAPPKVRVIATQVSKAFGLDFGAIDVLYNDPTNEAWVLEANSAPELGPHTGPLYANAFKNDAY